MRDARCLPGNPLREGKIVGWNARVFSIFLAFGTELEPTPLSCEYVFQDLTPQFSDPFHLKVPVLPPGHQKEYP